MFRALRSGTPSWRSTMWGKENANNQCLQHHENARGESSCSAHDRHARIPDQEETMAWHTFPNVSIETAPIVRS